MGYVITLFPHWLGMKICMYSFLWWEILLTICCLYCAGECRWQFLDARGLLGSLFLFFALSFGECIVLYNFATSFVLLPKFCCFPRLFPCRPFSAFCCVGWHVECPCFTAAFYFPVYFFVFLLSKYNLHGLYTPCSHSIGITWCHPQEYSTGYMSCGWHVVYPVDDRHPQDMSPTG